MKKITASSLLLAATAVSAFAADVFVNADITTKTSWSAANTYILEKPIFVRDGGELTIAAGTIVRGQPRTAAAGATTVGVPGALVITQTGKIYANGTATNPIIFTTAAVDVNNDNVADGTYPNFTKYTGSEAFLDDAPKTAPLAPLNGAGDSNVTLWGGIVICGNAPTNLADAEGIGFGKGLVEGFVTPGFEPNYVTFGGLVATDNSGILNYVSIRHAGDEIGDSNELNGLTLAGVGSGTQISNLEIYCNFDDGIEWFGGTVNSKNLAVFFAGDDAFDLDQGYTGFNQFCFAVQPFFAENDGGKFGSASGDKACEWDGDDSVKEFKISGTTYGKVADNNVAVRLALDFSAPAAGAEIAAPFSNPAFYNLTVLGSLPAGYGVTPSGNQEYVPTTVRGNARGVDMRHGFAGRLFSSIIVNTDGALDVREGTKVTYASDGSTLLTGAEAYYNKGSLVADAVDNAAAGLVIVANTTFAGVDAADFGTPETNATAAGDAITSVINAANVNKINAGTVASLIQNADTSFNPVGNVSGKLDSSLKASPINPRSKAGANNVNGVKVGYLGGQTVLYRGAFPTSTSAALWTDGWTALSIAGLLE